MLTAKVDYFPRTDENKDSVFKDWKCSHCLGTDPTSNGGTVAHNRTQISDKVVYDGASHPDHRDCTLANYKYRTACSHCGINLDLNNVLTRTEKLAVALAYLPGYLKRCVQSPRIMNSSGVFLLALGTFWKFPIICAIGSICLSRGLLPLESRQSQRAARARQFHLQSREALLSYANHIRSTEASLGYASQINRDLDVLATNLRTTGADIIEGREELLPIIDRLQQGNIPDHEIFLQMAHRAVDSLQQAKNLASKLKWISTKETLCSWLYKGARKCSQLAGIAFAMYAPYARSARS